MCNLNLNAPQHTCCCGCMHVKTGTWVVAILLAINWLSNISILIISGIVNHQSGILAIPIVTLIVMGIIVVCMFYGLRTERGVFMLPFLSVQIIGIVLYFIMIIICIIATSSDNQFAHDVIHFIDSSKDIDVRQDAGFMAAGLSFSITFQIWFAWVVYKCYNYFRESYSRV